jgi:F-type H+-transporting ATPase subunit delta
MLSDTATDAAYESGSILRGCSVPTQPLTPRPVSETAVPHRWSNSDDLLAGIEELGFGPVAESAPATVNIDAELFAFGTAVRHRTTN